MWHPSCQPCTIMASLSLAEQSVSDSSSNGTKGSDLQRDFWYSHLPELRSTKPGEAERTLTAHCKTQTVSYRHEKAGQPPPLSTKLKWQTEQQHSSYRRSSSRKLSQNSTIDRSFYKFRIHHSCRKTIYVCHNHNTRRRCYRANVLCPHPCVCFACVCTNISPHRILESPI